MAAAKKEKQENDNEMNVLQREIRETYYIAIGIQKEIQNIVDKANEQVKKLQAELQEYTEKNALAVKRYNELSKTSSDLV